MVVDGDVAERQRIVDVLARYCERVDAYDMVGTAELFSAEATADYGPGRGGPVHGRDAIRRRIAAGQAEFRRTHHQLGQSIVEVRGSEAEVLTYVMAWHERWDGERAVACLRYRDRLGRGAGGSWEITARQVEAAVVWGFPGVAWTWVSRAQPAVEP